MDKRSINTWVAEMLLVEIQEDDKIIVGGFKQEWNYGNMIVFRYLSNGEIDNSFNDKGHVYIDQHLDNYKGFIKDIKVLENGKILLLGEVGKETIVYQIQLIMIVLEMEDGVLF